MSVLRNEDFLVSGSNDAELRTWKISKSNLENSEIKISELLTSEFLPDFGVSTYLFCLKYKNNYGELKFSVFYKV